MVDNPEPAGRDRRDAYLPDALPVEPAPAEGALPFPTVAIGASAGGIEALQKLFQAMPRDSGCAFVVVMHLSPEFRSELVSVLARATALPVVQATDGMALQPDRVHVIGPGIALGIQHGRLRTFSGGPAPRRTHTIDRFMTELAADQRERAIGVVLSGTDGDGTIGIKAIKGEGGLTIAQLPSTASFPGMPNSAVASGMIDRQLAPGAIAEAIVGYAQSARLHQAHAFDGPQPQMEQLLDMLHRQVGLDFSGYKQPMLVRRVYRRMGLARCGDTAQYTELLRSSHAECEALAADFLISVTEFFREPQAWYALAEQVLPDLLAGKQTGDAVRAWVPGCATGEEAYSLGMLLLESPIADQRRLKLQVFATDLDRAALDVARKGCYPKSIEASVGAERLARFFVRDVITFAAQNLTYDPPFSRIDLVSCRNLLIYLKPELQRRVLQGFHYALVPGGVLALGKAETVAPLGHLFQTLVPGARLFRRVGPASLPERVPRVPSAPPEHAPATPALHAVHADHAQLLQEALGDERPECALLATRDGRVLYLRGTAQRFTRVAEGEPTSDLFAMLDAALRPHVRAAIHLAAGERRRVEVPAAVSSADGTETPVRIAVKPLARAGTENLLLICFEQRERAADAHAPPPGGEQQALRALEDELRSTKRDLQLAIEEMEAANEELKVAHEEAISTNEELQSTNEELETSQEELQSVNEELTTVNHQLQAKLEEVEQLNDDLSNLLASTSIPTVFLDRELRIKRFTPAATQLFRLIDGDVNRPLADIVTLDDAAAVLEDARTVLRELAPRSRETSAVSGRCWLRRTLPYRTREDLIGGVVITFNDITEVKQSAEGLRRLAAVMQGSSDAIVVHEPRGRILAWNQGASAMYGYTEAEALQRTIGELLPDDAARRAYDAEVARVLEGHAVQGIELRRLKCDGGTLDVSASLSLIRDDAGAPRALALIERDIGPRKIAEQRLRESEHRFRTLADNAPVLIWMSAADALLVFVNRHFATFVGLAPERLEGRALVELVHADDAGSLRSGLAALRPGHERFEAQLRLRHADGSWRWTRCSALLQPTDGVRAAHIVGTLVDVDAQVHSEELLLEASRHKDEFLAMLGHELRNPLAPIRNAAEVMLRVAPSDQRLNWAHDVLVRQVSHVTRLVDDLLDISLITRGAMQLRREPVDLVGILARAVEDVQPLLRSKHHRFEAKVPEPPLWVEGDPIRLAQVFQNLLTNAAKYTDERGEITLEAWCENGDVTVRVIDNGLGMAPEMIARVFDLFVQDPRAIDRSQGGLGIGLALVKHLVLKHGGTVEAHSAGIGRGSQFCVRLPRLKVGPQAPAAPAGTARSGNQGRVLVVDDDRESGESLCVLLELSGYEVHTAVGLDSALEEGARWRPQVVVMDIGLPGVDGWEVARRMRALPQVGSELRLIGLSGFARPSDVERSRSEGFSAYFAKPVEPDELVRAIAALLAPEPAATGSAPASVPKPS